jgi:hypothetical protein
MSLLSKYEFIERKDPSVFQNSAVNESFMAAGCPLNKILPSEKQSILFQNLGIPAGLVKYQNQMKWDVYGPFKGGKDENAGEDDDDDDEDDDDEGEGDKKYKTEGGSVISEFDFNNLFHLISIEHSRKNNKTRKIRR